MTFTANPIPTSHTVLRLIPGRLEIQVMEDLWAHGEVTVRDVVNRLDRPRAYTTIMTTLDRLYRKNMVRRRVLDRAYLYSPCLSRQDWKYEVARSVVEKLLAGSQTSRDLLLACLLEAAGQQEARLLSELKRRIRKSR
jgi:predicted transcriptional regulator